MGKANNNGDNRKPFTQWIVISIVLFVYFLLVLISYSNEMKKTAENAARAEFLAHVKAVAAAFSAETGNLEQTCESLAAAIGADGIVLSERSYDVLQRVLDSSDAIYGYVSDTTGNAVDNKGMSLNVWDDPDYGNALTSNRVVSEIKDHQGGEDTIAFYSPILDQSTVIGVACIQYPAEQFTVIPSLGDYDGYTTYALVKSDGSVVASIGGSKAVEGGTSIYDVMAEPKNGANGSEIARLRQCLENNKDCQAMVSIDGKPWFVNSAMIGVNGWYAIELHTGEFFDRMAMRLYDPTRKVLIRLFIALFLFFAAVIVLNVLNRTLYNRNAQELKDKAEHDLLTGLYNKMATEKHIQEHLEGDGKDEPAMLCVLDIDNFKKINDTMGHAFGDQVLSTLGVRLKNQFRSSDIIGRIGGDEFIVFLKKIPNDDIMNKEAEKLMNFFKDFKTGDYVKYNATASIGVAMYPEDGTNFEQLYKAADKGVYRSKQEGKNRLTLYRDIK